MQLPPAGAATARPASSSSESPGSASAPSSGGAAGFDAVMGGVLASGADATGGSVQQASDGGAQGKPATDDSGTVARAAKPEASKAAKDTAGAAAAADARGAASTGAAAGAVAGAVAAAAVAAGLAAGTAAPQGSAVLLDNTAALANVVPAGNPAPLTTPGTSAPATAVPTLSAPAPAVPTLSAPALSVPTLSAPAPAVPTLSAPALSATALSVPTAPPLGNPGQNSTQPGPGALPTSPLPAVPEPVPNTTAAPATESGAAVVLPTGKPATQQDPQRILAQEAPAAPAPGLPAGIQAGIPAVVQPATPLQQDPSAAAPAIAAPAPQAEPAKLLPQVSGPLFSLASAAPGAHVMTLRLSPEHLGPLTVRAHIDGAGVRIELFVPGEAGREAVRSILPELRRGLGESGFGASLDLSEHNAPADGGAGGSDSRDPDARDRRPAESFPRGSDGQPVRVARTAVVLPRSMSSSLDILV